MPARNVIKHYVPDYFYHIYNRGFNKSNIFLDNQDYSVFVNLLERALDPNLKILPSGFINTHNISQDIILIAYCLMPNHFHFLFKTISKEGVTKLLRRVLTSYVMYFNKKYEREGTIFQGKPRGIVIESESHLLHLTRYIHKNPLEIEAVKNLRDYPYSSYQEYIGIRKSAWVMPEEILSFFKSEECTSPTDILSYEHFVENYSKDTVEILDNLILE